MSSNPLDRFLNCVGKAPSGHWLWGAPLSNGYGNFWDGTRKVTAHRWAYEQWVGPIPQGHQVDHVCRIRHCVNPDHLEAVTPSENVGRSTAPNALRRKSSTCKHGHEFTPENTSITKKGGRRCRACARTTFRAYRERKHGRPLAPYNRDKTTCPRGHAYDEVNTYFDRNGGRQCRTCRQISNATSKARAKARREVAAT